MAGRVGGASAGLKKRRVLEWSAQLDAFAVVSLDEALEDRCFARPIPFAALMDVTVADREVVEALRARGALAAIERAAREAGRAEGREEGLRVAVRSAARLLGLDVDEERAKALESMDARALARLLETLERERRWP